VKEQTGKAPHQRQLRMGEALRHALVMVLRRDGLRDPLLAAEAHALTVSEVRIDSEAQRARVFVLPLGGTVTPEKNDAILKALNRAAPYLRGQVARELTFRHMPELFFTLDHSYMEAARIEALLKKIQPASPPSSEPQASQPQSFESDPRAKD
jgi:ribosome-binding factor A